MANRWGAPDYAANAIALGVGPACLALSRLGSERCQWAGQPKVKAGEPTNYTCWTLDGERATLPELLLAAGLEVEPE